MQDKVGKEHHRYGLRWSLGLPQPPLIESDPAVFLEAEPAVDRVAHLRGTKHADAVAEIPRSVQCREGNPRPDTPPPGTLDGEDEVDPHDPGPEERRCCGHGLPIQQPEVVSPRPFVAKTRPAVHLPDPLGLGRSLPKARAERLDPRCEPRLVTYPLD